jgi:3,4-dihydroxy-2-butanone 4-phosphate synthase
MMKIGRNEGDLIISAEHLTSEHINFMITYGKGLVCAPISSDIAKKLKLPLMQGVNNEMQTAYTASVDLKGNGVTTGISADDRHKTIKGLLMKNQQGKILMYQDIYFLFKQWMVEYLDEQDTQRQQLIYVILLVIKKLQ